MNKSMEIPKGYMLDAQGRLVLKRQIKAIDRKRDALVKTLYQRAHQISSELAMYKKEALEMGQAFIQESANEYGVTTLRRRGNITLTSYDETLRSQVAVADFFSFGERNQAAKGLIDECICTWSRGSRSEIRTLIDQAFHTDKQGKADTTRILGLRKLKFDDSRWIKAMKAISDSLTITNTKEYLRLYRRVKDGSYEPLPLGPAVL